MTRKARIGVIGAGWWAVANHIPVLKANPDCEIVAVNRLGARELAEVQRTFGIERGLRGLSRDAGQRRDGRRRHLLAARAAFRARERRARAGLPCAGREADDDHARRMRASCRPRRAGGARDRDRPWLELQAWTDEARTLSPRASGGSSTSSCRWRMRSRISSPAQPMKETEGAMFRPPPSTWADPKRAGGFGWGQLVHALGLLFRIADLEPREVFAADRQVAGRRRLLRRGGGALRRWRDGGSLSGAATVPKGRPVQIDLRIFGPEGMLLLDIERERLEAAPPRRPRRRSCAQAPATAPMPATSRSACSSISVSAARPRTARRASSGSAPSRFSTRCIVRRHRAG